MTDIYFSGDTYEPEHDRDRLARQLERVRTLMRDGEWRTLFEISASTGDPVQSVSARLRDFRKKRFGRHTVQTQRRGPPKDGLFEYRLILNGAEGEVEVAMTELEIAALAECEAEIERGLSGLGHALSRIRKERLYRATHKTFEAYCRERWKWSRSYVHRQIEAAAVATNLLPIGNKPLNEAQARELAQLPPQEQREVWEEAVQESNGKVTAAQLRDVRQRRVKDAMGTGGGFVRAANTKRSNRIAEMKALCHKLAGLPQPVLGRDLERKLKISSERAATVVSGCALIPWFRVEVIAAASHCAYRFSIDPALEALCESHTSVRPGIEPPARFFERLRTELRARREQIEGKRRNSNWDLTSVYKASLLSLLDWVERELSTYGQSVDVRQEAANQPQIIGQKGIA